MRLLRRLPCSSALWDTHAMDRFMIRGDVRHVYENVFRITAKMSLALDKEKLLLFQVQLGELVMNVKRHGRCADDVRRIRLYIGSYDGVMKVILEGHGRGFENMEDWNAFYVRRHRVLPGGALLWDGWEWMTYKHGLLHGSERERGGLGLCAAIHYWNEGLYYSNPPSNKTCACRTFKEGF